MHPINCLDVYNHDLDAREIITHTRSGTIPALHSMCTHSHRDAGVHVARLLARLHTQLWHQRRRIDRHAVDERAIGGRVVIATLGGQLQLSKRIAAAG